MRAMLNAHPNIYIAQEASFHPWVWQGRRRSAAERLQRWFDSFSFAFLGLDPGDVRALLPDKLGEEDLVTAFRVAMGRLSERNGAVRWGDKNPGLCPYIGRLYDEHPDARVIYMVRDPRPNVASLVTMPWATGSLTFATHLVRGQHAFTLPYRDRVLYVRLEDLISAPRPTFERVLEHVGEPWDDRVLAHHELADDGYRMPWLVRANKQRGGARPRDWRTQLSPQWIRLVESTCWRIMADHGYTPAQLEREPAFGTRFTAVLRDVPAMLGYGRQLLQTFRRFWGGDPPAVEALKLLTNHNPRGWELHPEWELPPVPQILRARTR